MTSRLRSMSVLPRRPRVFLSFRSEDRERVTVCLLGEELHISEWVNWELEESFERWNTVIAMALKGQLA